MITVGLDANRAMTEAFIAVAPVEIVLRPQTKAGDGTGGRTATLGAPRTAQTFSLLEPGNSAYSEAVATDAGKQQQYDFLLLGKHDAVMAQDDVFQIDGKDYIIVKLLPDNGYEKRGMVLRHGW